MASSEDLFWRVVEYANWPEHSKGADPHVVVAARIADRFTLSEILAAERVYKEKLRAVNDIVFNEPTPEDLDTHGDGQWVEGGDDSHNDFCAHMVSRGRDVYDRCMADHRELWQYRHDYRESFSYVWHPFLKQLVWQGPWPAPELLGTLAFPRYGLDEVVAALSGVDALLNTVGRDTVQIIASYVPHKTDAHDYRPAK